MGCGVCEEAGRVGLGARTLVLGEIFFFCGSANQKGKLRNLTFSFVKLGSALGYSKSSVTEPVVSVCHTFWHREISIHEYSFWSSFLTCPLTPYPRELGCPWGLWESGAGLVWVRRWAQVLTGQSSFPLEGSIPRLCFSGSFFLENLEICRN